MTVVDGNKAGFFTKKCVTNNLNDKIFNYELILQSPSSITLPYTYTSGLATTHVVVFL